MLSRVHVRLYDTSIVINIIAVEAGTMIVIFSDHSEMTRGCIESLTSGGDARFRDFLSTSQKKGFLLGQSYHN